jgi:hypothetical protein
MNADAPAVKREAEEDWVKTDGDDRNRLGGAYPKKSVGQPLIRPLER